MASSNPYHNEAVPMHKRIAAGENLGNLLDVERILDAGAVDVVQPDPIKMGGITECWKALCMAQERGVTYVKLDGDVGILGNGAGLVMSTVDVIAQAGGRPANFCDVGGGASAEKIATALGIVLSDAKAEADAVVPRQVRRAFRRRHDVIGRQRVLGVRQRDFDDGSARRLHHLDPLLPQRHDLGRSAVDAVLLRDADLHALDRAADRLLVVGHREVGASGVLGVVPCHRAQKDRAVAHGARERPRLIERRRKRDDPPARAAPVGRLDADRGRDRGNRDRNRDRGNRGFREEREIVISEDDVLLPVGGLLDILDSAIS